MAFPSFSQSSKFTFHPRPLESMVRNYGHFVGVVACSCVKFLRPLGNMGGVKKHRGFGCGLFVEPRGI